LSPLNSAPGSLPLPVLRRAVPIARVDIRSLHSQRSRRQNRLGKHRDGVCQVQCREGGQASCAAQPSASANACRTADGRPRISTERYPRGFRIVALLEYGTRALERHSFLAPIGLCPPVCPRLARVRGTSAQLAILAIP